MKTKSPTDAAWEALRAHARDRSVDPAVLSAVVLIDVQDSGSGPILVRFQQRIDGVDLFRGEVTVSLTRLLQPLSVTGELCRSASKLSQDFGVDARPAIAVAVKEAMGLSIPAAQLSSTGISEGEGGYQNFAIPAIKAGRRHTAPGSARTRRTWFAIPTGVVPAYYIELTLGWADGSADLRSYIVSAAGAVLFRNNLTNDSAPINVPPLSQ